MSTPELVRIDDQGIFKYILINITKGDTTHTVVRGWLDCDYHADVLAKFNRDEPQAGCKVSCPGGGRISRQGQKITIFGYSVSFGKADHAVTCQLIQDKFGPNYQVEWNNEGY